VIQQKNVQPGRTQFGIGDTTQSIFFSPKKPTASGWIWGAGPVALIPTGYDGLGASTFAIGPTFVMLKQTGIWTYGILANQLWNIGGAADISSMFLQPFLVRSLGKGRSLALNTETSYDWIREEWNVPINLATRWSATSSESRFLSKPLMVTGRIGDCVIPLRCCFPNNWQREVLYAAICGGPVSPGPLNPRNS